MTKIKFKAKRLSIYIGESDNYKRQVLYKSIIGKMQELGMAGVTVFRGIMGYGADKCVHTANVLDLSSDLPIMVEIIDSEESIVKLLPYLDEMLEKGLVTLDDVEVWKYGREKL